MSTTPLDEEAIFKVACQIGSPMGRAEYLGQVCGGDGALHERVAFLLQMHEGSPSFLESPAQAFSAAAGRTIDMPAETPVAAAVGTVIGSYKLLQQIGEGGMGVVYMAEQAAPVRRKVALKIIKPGMDSREVIARFEAERQALALMDHPNIARVYDGGATDTGRPYFVMELVRGVPITDYCDQNKLPIYERLELFVTVCHAVQHAHQKGIIHRDIKPTNVLVTLHDGRPLPKVIDFGVAKAIGQQLTEKTLFTQFAQMVGTPLYMSPEQAQMTGLDVDTRCDIYSLGVLMYELLTATTPFERARMNQAALDEVRRMIREEDPPSPSMRLSSTAGKAQSVVAADRRVDHRGLSRLVRGDLDWIVMKALEKDRNRRYETANGFAADVVRFLSNEPVEACPPSAAYRFRKFVRRNRGPVFAAGLVLATLLVGVAGTTIGLLQARAERDNVVAAQSKVRLALIDAEESFQTARDAVDKMYTRAAEEMRDKPQMEQIRRALLEEAVRFYQRFLKRKSEDSVVRYEMALAHRRVGEIYGYLGELKESLKNHREATVMLTALSPQLAFDSRYCDELARAHFHCGYALMGLMQLDEGTSSLQESISRWELLTNEFPETPSYLEDLARANYVLGRGWTRNYHSKGQTYVTRGQELLSRLKQLFPSHEISSSFKFELKELAAWRYTQLPHDMATLKQLERECRDQLAAAEASVLEHPDAPRFENEVVGWFGRMANVLLAMNRFEELEQQGIRTMEIRQRLAAQHPESPDFQSGLAWEHYNKGGFLYLTDRPDEALVHFRTAITIASDLTSKHPDNRRFHAHLGEMIRRCPVPQLRDPKRVLKLALRVRELGDVGWEDVAWAEIDAGLYREALASCQESTKAGRQTDILAYVTAIAFWHLGRQDEARELMRQIFLRIGSQPNQYWWTPDYRWKSREAAKLMGLEIEELNAGNAEKVLRNGIALYIKFAAERPGDSGILQELGRCYAELSQLMIRTGRNGEAEQLLQEGVEAYAMRIAGSDAHGDDRMRLGNMLWQLADSSSASGHYDETEKALRRALDVFDKLAADFPANRHYRMEQGFTQWRLGIQLNVQSRFIESEELFRRELAVYKQLVSEDPQNLEFRRRLSQCYNELGKTLARQEKLADAAVEWDNAVAEYGKAIELKPDAWESWSERAFIHLNRQQWEQAASDFSKAIDLAPQVHTNWWHRGHINLHLAQWEKAAFDFGKALDQWPDGGDGWHLRSIALAQLNQPDKAISDLRQAVAKGFKNVDAIKNDSRFDPLRTREDFRELMREFERKVNPDVK